MSYPAVLIGGPHDGRDVTHTKANTIETVFAMPLSLITGTPRPRWWRHPVKYLRWKPPPPPEPPKLIQLRYTADGTTDNGRRVFRLASPWQPYRGPEAEDDGGIYPALAKAMYAVHPAIRQDGATRWVMNPGWHARIRRDPNMLPDPDDMVFGTRIRVTADGGAPHLENPRFPQGWPS
jgi:hypothetical protein